MILPPVTRPWRTKISRRHTPRSARGTKGFRDYRPCLRWEFGFSCSFCLCHEADLAPWGIEGTALTHVEHFVPQSHDATLKNHYLNCFYICRFCNVSRGAALNEEADGQSLLNPCDYAWLESFTLSRDELRPRDDSDGDAVYTWETYELNDPRKRRMRSWRRITIGQCTRFLRRTRALERDLLDQVGPVGGMEHVDLAWEIARQRRRAYMDLLKFRAVPHDRDTSCPCNHTAHHRLPAMLMEQLIDPSSFRRSSKK